MHKIKKKENWKALCKRLGKDLPLKTKKDFLTLMHRGSSVESAAKKLLITVDEAHGVLQNNITSKMMRYLNKPEEAV